MYVVKTSHNIVVNFNASRTVHETYGEQTRAIHIFNP